MNRSLRRRAARTGAALVTLGALVAAGATALPAQAAPSGGSTKSQLGKHDRELLAEARAAGERTVTLLIASAPGKNSTVASALAAMGATVVKREDAVDYLRARVAIGSAEKAANLSGIVAADLDEVVPLEDPRPDAGASGEGSVAPTPYAPPGAGTPQINPYMPIGDTGAAQFQQSHPTYDGRGVTIGIVDSGIDLDHPALQTTTTGERKITDWVTATDETGDDDPTWLDMKTQVSASPTFTSGGTTYTAPSAGTFRFAVFNERDPRLGGEVGSDVNRDGNPAGSSGTFGVLWNTGTNDVYVDTNQNGSFADEQAMTDYRARNDVGHFGTDNPATSTREQMPFVVQTDGRTKFVNIGIVSGAHGSHVAGITAANGMFGGAMTGAAPGAKLKAVRVCMFITGCTAHALIEGMTFIAKQGNVDVINMSIGGLPALNDGNNTRAVLYDRLIETYNVQMFISAGNSGAGLNTIGDPSVASKVMSIGSYITNATWRSNYGSSTVQDDNIHPYSSRGPREDGGFKPQVLAPGSAVSTIPTWQSTVGACLPYNCPTGYAMFNGTSMASPQAAGAAALLVSAAKQAGVQSQPAQLRQAINSSARFIDGYGAFEQGNGLMNVPAAWDLLKKNAKTVDIRSSVPVNTVLSGFLATPGVGQGIYDREGVTAGDSYTRTYTFTRTSGGGGTRTYALSWVGNDGTFSTEPTSIALPLNTAKTLEVTVHPTSSGIHSAVLNLDDATNPGIEAQTMNTVVAADRFTAGANYTVSKSGTIARNQSKSFFFYVPAGTPAFKVDLAAGGDPGKGQVRFLRFHPYGVGLESNSTPNYYNPPVPGCSAGCSVAAATSRTTSNPTAGVWEVTVEARRTSDVLEAPFTLTASILGASVSPNPDVITSATLGAPIAHEYTLTNLFGPFTGRAVGTTLGSAKRATPTIANGAQQQYPVTVTAGSTSLRATIGGTSDPAADLDLFVFNCTSGTCVLAGQSADGDSEESVTVNNPAAGTWVVLVDGYAVPAGTTTYNYVDVFTNAAFGSVSVTDANALRPAAFSWTVPGAVTVNAAPAAGRVLLGNVQVRTDANVLIGSGDVVVESVTP
ncbi:MAG TPA: S8 family serine peptidase [Actinomycetes bacterium]